MSNNVALEGLTYPDASRNDLVYRWDRKKVAVVPDSARYLGTLREIFRGSCYSSGD